MPVAKVRGLNINYEVLGSKGPWMMLSPGGRRDLNNIRSLAQRMAGHGYRVLIHDRRNCGLSDIEIGGETSEYEIWVDDLRELLTQLGALPVILGGGSSGCRLSMLYALKYPQDVRALLLFRVTGGAFAARRLTENYYGQYIRAAEQGGMAAVCALDHFKERAEARPENRAKLMAMDPADFVARMRRWQQQFEQGASLPIVGVTDDELKSVRIPTIVIPGNDKTHAHASAEHAHRLIPGAELYDLFPGDVDVDLLQMDAWAPKEGEMADVLADFLRRNLRQAA